MRNYTVVVAIDERTLNFLEVSLPNWAKYAPQLFKQPWVVIVDGEAIKDPFHMIATRLPALIKEETPFVVLPWYSMDSYGSQREKMLSAHVFVSRIVTTQYSLKIDCDAFLTRPVPEFPLDVWFENSPILVGSPWGYTRAKGGGDLDSWIETLEGFGDEHYQTPRAGWAEKITDRDHRKGPKMKETRLASWVCFQETYWVRGVATRFEMAFGPKKLPVPSHDTSLWAAAVRSGREIKYAKMKNHGWGNRTTLKGLKEAVACYS